MNAFFKRTWKAIIIIAFLGASISALALFHKQASWNNFTAADGSKWLVQMGTGKIQPVLDSQIKNPNGEKVFGAGYSPVTGFQTLTTSRVASNAATIPVASVTDKAGNAINTANISSSSTVRMYFNFEPGTPREEPFYCTGISSLNLTGCVRGIAFQGSDLSASSSIAQIHNAGAAVVMTNLGVFYGNEFVSISGNQTLFDVKLFTQFPGTTSTTATPASANEFATKYYVDNIGAGGFTSSNVSSTLGLQAISSGVPNCPSAAACVGLNASSTTGFAFDLSGRLFLSVSSTGGLSFDQSNALRVDGSKNFTFTGTNTYKGTNLFVAGSASIYVPTPTDPGMAANQNYVDLNVGLSSATGTAGAAITAGNAIYASTTGTMFIADSSTTSTAYYFAGIAENTVTSTNQVTYVKPGGIANNLSGLSRGRFYYLSTSGALSLTPGTIPVRVGLAITTSTLQVLTPGFHARASGTLTGWNVASVTASLGWQPSRVDFMCQGASQQYSVGTWQANSNGGSSQFATGVDDSGAPYSIQSNAAVCKWKETANTFTGTFATTTNGFTITTNNLTAARNINYIATYDSDSSIAY